MHRLWNPLRRFALWFDTFFEGFAIASLTAMTLIVTLQVITRKVFNFVFMWSEEITLLLLIWSGFMGIAIGFRENLHIAMTSFAKLLPKAFQRALDRLIPFCVVLFGLFLIKYGWEFTALMHANKLPATEMPVSVQYGIMPITGIMTCIYGLIQLMGIDTARHREFEEEIPE